MGVWGGVRGRERERELERTGCYTGEGKRETDLGRQRDRETEVYVDMLPMKECGGKSVCGALMLDQLTTCVY